MLVLTDPLDRCWTLGLSLSHAATHTHSHAVGVSMHKVRGVAEFTAPPHLSFSLSPPFAPTCCPASPLPFFFSTFVGFSCFVRAVHSRFTVKFLRFVVAHFHCFHQSVTLDKTRDLDVCLKNGGSSCNLYP